MAAIIVMMMKWTITLENRHMTESHNRTVWTVGYKSRKPDRMGAGKFADSRHFLALLEFFGQEDKNLFGACGGTIVSFAQINETMILRGKH